MLWKYLWSFLIFRIFRVTLFLYSEVSAPELNQLGVYTYTFTAGYQNLSSTTMNEEIGLLNSNAHT